ncbi:MAG: DnaB-like helicase C-terminal domain-containing protein [Bacteroidota bacterium]|jgi:replicative DNA helicase|nr:AAA family ATPase [Sphingobacteriales bacterium]
MNTSQEFISIQRQVLSTLIQHPHLFGRYAEKIRLVYFTEPAFKQLLLVMRSLNQAYATFDLHLLRNELKKESEEANLVLVDEMANEIAEQADLEIKLNALKEYTTRKMFFELGETLFNKSMDSDIPVADLQTTLSNCMQVLSGMQSVGNTESLKEILNRIKISSESDESYTWFDSNLQAHLGSIESGELIVIGARPGIGKTAFLHTQLLHLASHHQAPVGYINIIENERALIAKLLKASGEDLTKAENENLSLNGKTWPIYLCSNLGGTQLKDIKNAANFLKYKYDIKVLAIDCFQQITYQSKMNYRDYELGMVVQELKKIAKELDIAILLTSQLNRSAERRGYVAIPMLCDLKETGYLEEVADKVLLLHRYAYYGINVYEDGTPTGNDSNVLIAKNKYGKSGKVLLSFDSKLGKFLPKAQPLPMVFEFPANRLTDLE